MTQGGVGDSPSSPGRLAPPRRWPWILLGLVLIWFFPYQEHLNNPNENVRIYTTRALVEHGTAAIGQRVREGTRLVDRGSVLGEWGWVNDRALRCDQPSARPPQCTGTLLAAKAPGLSLLAVVPYAALSALHHGCYGVAPGKSLTVRVLRLTVVTLPWFGFLLLLYRRLRQLPGVEPAAAELAVLGLGLGSIATPYALLFAGHTPTAMALGGALLALNDARGRGWRLALGGGLLGLAVALEYPMALPAAVLGLYGLFELWRGERWAVVRGLAWLVGGGLVPVLGLLTFHTLLLGSPWLTPYAFLENPAFIKDAAPGLSGIAGPGWQSLLLGLGSPQVGLGFFMPAVLLAPVGAVMWLRTRAREGDAAAAGAARRLGWVLLLVLATFLYLLAAMPNLRKMLGWTVGPRYIVGLAPFAALGLARAASGLQRRWSGQGLGLATGLVLVGVVLCGVPALLYGTYPMSFTNPSFQLGLPLLWEGYWPYSLGTALGLTGWLAPLPGLVAAGGVLLALLAPSESRGWPRLRHALLAAGLAVALLGLWSWPGRTLEPAAQKDAAWVRQRWEPPRGAGE